MSDEAATVDPDVLTPVAQDYLKVIWSGTEWGGPPLGTGELATRFGTSPATVTETVRRLAGQGLVEYVPYRPVRLTATGAACAIAMVRRHRILETYLVEELGYGWDEVHEEAERLEHAATPRLIDRIDARLGHPRTDPHGDPIPCADGTTTLPPDTGLLADVRQPGPWEVLRISDADPALLDDATEPRLVPGHVVEVALDGVDAGGTPPDAPDASPAVIAPDGTRTVVPPELAAAVRGRGVASRAAPDPRASLELRAPREP